MADHSQSTTNAWLDAATFKMVVTATPLISIDLLVQNEQGEFLLGLRNNRPAQGYWFVPGGRILKNETLDTAFRRLTREELGTELERGQASFKGLYEHVYDDSVFGPSPATHYIVLAHYLQVAQETIRISPEQHCQSQWVTPEAMNTLNIHRFTWDYFEEQHAK